MLEMSDTDEESSDQKMKIVASRLSAKLKDQWNCDTHMGSCVITNGGIHVRLIPRDFASWATMIVSCSYPSDPCVTLTQHIELALQHRNGR